MIRVSSRFEYIVLNSEKLMPYFLFVEGFDLFDLVVAAHKDAGAVVDVFGHYLEHAAHLAVDSLATSCFLVSFHSLSLFLVAACA